MLRLFASARRYSKYLVGIEPDRRGPLVPATFLLRLVHAFMHQAHERDLSHVPVAENADGHGTLSVDGRPGQHLGGGTKAEIVATAGFEDRLVAQEAFWCAEHTLRLSKAVLVLGFF